MNKADSIASGEAPLSSRPVTTKGSAMTNRGRAGSSLLCLRSLENARGGENVTEIGTE